MTYYYWRLFEKWKDANKNSHMITVNILNLDSYTHVHTQIVISTDSLHWKNSFLILLLSLSSGISFSLWFFLLLDDAPFLQLLNYILNPLSLSSGLLNKLTKIMLRVLAKLGWREREGESVRLCHRYVSICGSAYFVISVSKNKTILIYVHINFVRVHNFQKLYLLHGGGYHNIFTEWTPLSNITVFNIKIINIFPGLWIHFIPLESYRNYFRGKRLESLGQMLSVESS